MIIASDPIPTLLALTGPFACGKTKLAEALKKQFDVCVTATTRPPRKDEVNGKHYFFYDTPTFMYKRDVEKYFVETAEINGYLYGTPRSSLEAGIMAGKQLMVVVDPQGILSLMHDENEAIRDALISIYIEVDFHVAIIRALSRPSPFTPLELEKRKLTRIKEEAMKHHCQHRINNPNGAFDETLAAIQRIVARRRKEWQCGI